MVCGCRPYHIYTIRKLPVPFCICNSLWVTNGTTPQSKKNLSQSFRFFNIIKFGRILQFIPFFHHSQIQFHFPIFDKFNITWVLFYISPGWRAADNHYNTMQHIATHCNSLQHIATHCYTLQHTAIHCNTLQHTASHCNALLHNITLWFRELLIVGWSVDVHWVHMCDMTHSYVRHGSFVCVTWFFRSSWPELQHTATTANSLQHTVTHCNTDWFWGCRSSATALPRNKASSRWSQYTATHCNTLQHTATHCNTLRQSVFFLVAADN